mgnify:CR=1 FL=1
MEFQKLNAPSLKELFISELENMIISGKLPIGTKLPSERELATSMQVSRAVVNSGIAELEKNGSYTLQLDGTDVVVEAADVEIFSEDIPGWLVANEGKLTVALDVTVTEELRREGIARELVNRIQNIRKSSGLEITDKIKITLSKNQQTDDAVNEYKDYICNQVLGTSLTLTDEVENGTELNFDDFSLYVSVVKE